jgi:hypothetical protein
VPQKKALKMFAQLYLTKDAFASQLYKNVESATLRKLSKVSSNDIILNSVFSAPDSQ